jgi:hypothetical protein
MSSCRRASQAASPINGTSVIACNTQRVNPLHQRTLDAMRLRGLEPKTLPGYLRVVRRFITFVGRAPDIATVEDQ